MKRIVENQNVCHAFVQVFRAHRNKAMSSEDRVESIKQLAAQVGLSKGQIRHLINTGQLEYVKVGSRDFIPVGAFSRYLARKTRCLEETKDRACGGSQSDVASTSFGQSMAAAASARLARQTANKLKSRSQSGCAAEGAAPGRVIPLKSS